MTMKPFSIDAPDGRLARIRQRLSATILTYAPDADRSWKYGTDVAYLRNFVRSGINDYDWRTAERA